METSSALDIHEDAHPLRGVAKLQLSNFRCYETFQTPFDLKPVVITGPNGAGKTNILEALSYLIPGRGLRNAVLADVRRQGTHAPWAISVHLKDQRGDLHIGTGLDPEEGLKERRLTKINGEKVKSQSALTEWVSVVWLTPLMDRLFLEGPQGRRRFLDRIVYGVIPLHAQRLARYEKALKERSRLLEEETYDQRWMNGLEDILVTEGLIITKNRQNIIQQLKTFIQNQESSFPRAEMVLGGELEKLLYHHSMEEAESKMRISLAQSRTQGQRPALGPHRSDLLVTYPEKNQPAALCSTGEQKALLLSIVMASASILSQRTETLPLLLLDEVVAHLDEGRRAALFDAIIKLRIQAWLTGTDVALFESIKDKAQFLRLKDAQISAIT